MLTALDNLWLDLRRVNRRLTKSALVAWIIDQALKEYQEKGRESPLFQALAGKEEE